MAKRGVDVGKHNPIGIFDSGIGGLTVVQSLIEGLYHEDFIYFGDTAHVPYGNKSAEDLFTYAYNIINFLIKNQVKAVVVACGTHSSVTLPKISQEYDLPILGVVEPGAQVAANSSQNKRIGLLATQATTNSLAYTKAINTIDDKCQVFEVACPKFVPLVEKGDLSSAVVKDAVVEYLRPLLEESVDTIVLGCTHYPFLNQVIQDYVGANVRIIDPSFATVESLKNLLSKQGLLNDRQNNPSREFYVSGNDESFYKVGNLLLGNIITKVSKVNLD